MIKAALIFGFLSLIYTQPFCFAGAKGTGSIQPGPDLSGTPPMIKSSFDEILYPIQSQIHANIATFLTDRDLLNYSLTDQKHFKAFREPSHASLELLWKERFLTLYCQVRPDFSQEDLLRIQSYQPHVIQWPMLMFLLQRFKMDLERPRVRSFKAGVRMKRLALKRNSFTCFHHCFAGYNRWKNEPLEEGRDDLCDKGACLGTSSIGAIEATAISLTIANPVLAPNLLVGTSCCTLCCLCGYIPPCSDLLEENICTPLESQLKSNADQAHGNLVQAEIDHCKIFWNPQSLDPDLYRQDVEQLRSFQDPVLNRLLNLFHV